MNIGRLLNQSTSWFDKLILVGVSVICIWTMASGGSYSLATKGATGQILHNDQKLTTIDTEMEDSRLEPRQLFIVRHGERMDYAFGYDWIDWVDDLFDEKGHYKSQGQERHPNIPITIPKKIGGTDAYDGDAPLTVKGHKKATKLGEILKKHGVNISHVYTSPSLRCIETAASILKGMEMDQLLHVEPGLFELLSLYHGHVPQFMTPDELIASGFNVSKEHEPIWPTSAYDENEDRDEMYVRHHRVVSEILNRHQQEGGNVLIVGHAASLDTCVRQLLDKPRATSNEFHRTLCAAYCEVNAIQEDMKLKAGKRTWKQIPIYNMRSF